ncbi:MAG: hypothetical protein HYW24_01535 [Candidatus Aenigmarchaeota archaeon]|nr:hypothetical protein [Candidatus Aenigmarchaeota archaeon]
MAVPIPPAPQGMLDRLRGRLADPLVRILYAFSMPLGASAGGFTDALKASWGRGYKIPPYETPTPLVPGYSHPNNIPQSFWDRTGEGALIGGYMGLYPVIMDTFASPLYARSFSGLTQRNLGENVLGLLKMLPAVYATSGLASGLEHFLDRTLLPTFTNDPTSRLLLERPSMFMLPGVAVLAYTYRNEVWNTVTWPGRQIRNFVYDVTSPRLGHVGGIIAGTGAELATYGAAGYVIGRLTGLW